MSDDRELVERLAAIDATPRAGWVAELRADLDAAWETEDPGYLDSLRTTTVTLVDRRTDTVRAEQRSPVADPHRRRRGRRARRRRARRRSTATTRRQPTNRPRP